MNLPGLEILRMLPNVEEKKGIYPSVFFIVVKTFICTLERIQKNKTDFPGFSYSDSVY